MAPWLVLLCVPNCVSLTSCVVGDDVTHHFPHLTHCMECQIGFTYISKENEIRKTFETSVRCHICFCLFGEGKPFGPAHILASFNFIFGATGVSQEEISNWPEQIWLCMASEAGMTHAHSMSYNRNTQGILYTTEEADMLGSIR